MKYETDHIVSIKTKPIRNNYANNTDRSVGGEMFNYNR